MEYYANALDVDTLVRKRAAVSSASSVMRLRALFEREIFARAACRLSADRRHRREIFKKSRGKRRARCLYRRRADIFFSSLSFSCDVLQMTIRLTDIYGSRTRICTSRAVGRSTCPKNLARSTKAVQCVAPANSRVDIRVEMFANSGSNKWKISTRIQPYEPVMVTSGALYNRSFEIGYRDYFHLEVPQGLHKVQYTYTPTARALTSYRRYTDLSVNIPASDNATDYKLYDEMTHAYKTMKVYDDQSETYATDRGLTEKRYPIYLWSSIG